MKKNNFMILGAGRGQTDLIRAVAKYGYNPLVTSVQGNYPGLKMGYDVCLGDISSPNQICQLAKENNIVGIATACLDTGVPALGYTCDQLKLSGLKERAATISGNKLLMKEAFMDAQVNTAKFVKVSSREELLSAVEKLEFPVIVKAIDLQGSRGISIVRSIDNIYQAFDYTMQETREDYCIIEEFLEGYEFGAQAFVAAGEVLFVLPCGDITYQANTNIPVGHYAPLELENDILKQVEEQARKAIEAIGLDNCAVNIDFILKDNKVYVIELTGRIGANCLPQITSIYYGIDIYKMIIDMAVGVNPKKYFVENKKEATASYALMLYAEKSGVLKKIVNNNCESEDIEEITFFVESGDEVRKFNNSRDCIGQIVIKGKNLEYCKHRMDEVLNNIEFVLE